MTSFVEAFVSRRWGAPRGSFYLDVGPVEGGLESRVSRARISGARQPSAMPSRLVVKQLPHGGEREAEVYDVLWRCLGSPPAARVHGRDEVGGRTYLYLEDVLPHVPWPWSDATRASAVCRELARFHDHAALPRQTFTWDYEAELAQSAASTLALAATARDAEGRRCWTRLSDLRRVVSTLPAIRRRLLAGPTTVIHGDVHPGNVMLRGPAARLDVVLIDWARARVGSPLEDVASWLHSLGCWEPVARQRHDTLMRAYLSARRVPQAFTPDVRRAYWLASVSNGLSGAIRYHLAVLIDPDRPEATRHDSRRALDAWRRVVRRASGLVSTSLDR